MCSVRDTKLVRLKEVVLNHTTFVCIPLHIADHASIGFFSEVEDDGT